MDQQRRDLMVAGAVVLGVQAVASPWARASEEDLRVPTAPAKRSPGVPGQFDFLSGQWRIQHRRLPQGAHEWDEFEGEATCWSILGGVGSVEELRIPARNFSGMGLRLLDVDNQQWFDHWVNAKSGVIGCPGLAGSFEDGAGLFYSEEQDGEQTILAASIWDQIERRSCRWRQAVSRDGGASWEHNWIMRWHRV